MHVSDRAFRRLVEEALALVPAEFRPYLAGVPVVIEDWAPDALLDELGVPEDETLYGLYTGRPLTEGWPQSGELPPRITIYRGRCWRIATTGRAAGGDRHHGHP